MSPDPDRGLAPFARAVAAPAAAALLFLALGEAGTRALNRDGRLYDLEMYRYSRTLKRRAPPAARAMHHWHVPGASAMLQGVPVSINSRGLRDREHDYAVRPGTTRVLVLGDSITLGWGVRAEDSYPQALERLLNATNRDRRYEVVNGGVGNYTTRRIIALYDFELHRYSAPVVVFSFFINNANEAPDSRLRFLFDTPLQFPVFVWSRLQRVRTRYGLGQSFDDYYQRLYADDSPAFAAFREDLGRFLAQLRSEGRTVLVVSVPDVLHLQEPSYRYQWLTDKVFRIAQSGSAATLDLYPSVKGLAPGQIMNTPEDRHPNPEGHRRFAEALRARLQSLGI